jgi:glycosyltransferase involved in cell wall biosynthesis
MVTTVLEAPARTLRALQIGMTAVQGRRGGVDRYYFNLIRALDALDVRTHGLVAGDRSAVDAEALQASMECFAADGTSLLTRWGALRRAVGRAVPETDVVVSHFAPYAFPVLDQIRTKPLAVHFHGPWALESAVEGAGTLAVRTKRLIEQAVYRTGDRFIVLSQAFADILAGEYGVARDAIRIIPGGVDVGRFRTVGSRADARRALGWPVDRPTIVTVRRLVRAKGLERLIDAAVEIRAAIPDVALHIVGTGPLAADLAERVRERGLETTVSFAGFVGEEQLADVYRAADLFVVPTVALEGFGLVVVEALACGTPVVVTPVAGLPEVVRDLDPSLVLASADAPDIARGVIDALRGTVPVPSEAACVAYAQRFDWPVIARRVRAVYAEIA